MTRTFIALEMDEAAQRHLEIVIQQVAHLLPDIRWVAPEGIHLTLAFLGELNDEDLAAATQAARAAAQQASSFNYRLSRLGVFGPMRQPRVIWLGIDVTGNALTHLHRTLHHELARRDFEIDSRPFSPHLTLARLKHPLAPDEQQRLQQLLAGPQHGLVSTTLNHARSINVMKSELLRTGARYTCLQAYTLKIQ